VDHQYPHGCAAQVSLPQVLADLSLSQRLACV
jgi:hypothetical protein